MCVCGNNNLLGVKIITDIGTNIVLNNYLKLRTDERNNNANNKQQKLLTVL